MRLITVCMAVILWLVCAYPLRGFCDNEAQARKVIDAAMEAIGGEARLVSFNAATWQSEGTLRVNNNTSEFHSDWSIQGRSRYRKAKTSTQNGREIKSTVVLHDDRAWFRRDNDLFSFTGKQLEPACAEAYAHWLALRLDIRAPARLSLLGEHELDGRPALAVKVREDDAPDVDLYFDKQTSLLVRMDTYVGTPRRQAEAETRVFSDYKESGGIKYASKVQWTGRIGDDLAVQTEQRFDFRPFEMLDASIFGEP